jgi:hypothetical protein
MHTCFILQNVIYYLFSLIFEGDRGFDRKDGDLGAELSGLTDGKKTTKPKETTKFKDAKCKDIYTYITLHPHSSLFPGDICANIFAH